MQMLIELIDQNQAFLVKRTLEYAKVNGYVKYTSTLEEAWTASILGLSEALIKALLNDSQIPEIEVDHDFTNNAISSFGVLEAKRHRRRGVTLEMFLSLMKYYRQAYIDLITQSIQDLQQQDFYLLWVNRYFDHNEIAFCAEWAAIPGEKMLQELQMTNRNLTNEKNKYLTIFESMPAPAVILDTEHRCVNMNYVAQQILQETAQSPGKMYYSKSSVRPHLSEVLPWVYDEFMVFYKGGALESSIEKCFVSPTLGERYLFIKFHRMMDISNKFEGTVILFDDLTERKKIEEKLRKTSFYDTLTGLYNRAYMADVILRMDTGRFNPVGFISIDVDGLKLVNDNLGHNAGDNLLIAVSRIISASSGESGIAVRNGGDEFAVIMALSDAQAVQTMCERIRSGIEEHNSVSRRKPISISIGMSVGDIGVDRVMNEIMKEADDRMYADKQGKRLTYAAVFNDRFEQYGQALFDSGSGPTKSELIHT